MYAGEIVKTKTFKFTLNKQPSKDPEVVNKCSAS